MVTVNGEFKGATQQALRDLRQDFDELKAANEKAHANVAKKVDDLNQRFWFIIAVLVYIAAQQGLNLVNLVLAR